MILLEAISKNKSVILTSIRELIDTEIAILPIFELSLKTDSDVILVIILRYFSSVSG